MSCRHDVESGLCFSCYLRPGMSESAEVRAMPDANESREVKVVNARVKSAEIYCAQGKLDEVGHTVELVFEYAGGVTQRTGRLSSRLAGPVMQVAEVSSWSEVAGKVVRVRCSRDDVYAIGHALEDTWHVLVVRGEGGES